MSDFTSEELSMIGEALEFHYDAAVHMRVKDQLPDLLGLRTKVSGLLGNILDHKQKLLDSMDKKPVQLLTGEYYLVAKQGHKLDGQRVKLEIIHREVDGGVRTWVIDGLLNTVEVPYDSLVRCE